MADIAATQTSNSQNWRTPKWLFNLLDKEFNFELDVCADEENSLCDLYYDEEVNGLKQDWFGMCWCNPPYNEAKSWVEKAFKEAEKGNCTAVLLIAARPDTRYWWDYIRYGEVRFLPGRLKFEGGKHSAPFPSAIVIFYGGGYLYKPETIYWNVREPK